MSWGAVTLASQPRARAALHAAWRTACRWARWWRRGRCSGFAENGMRVAVTRLLGAGELARDERGRYRLGPAAVPLNERIVSWRSLEERLCRWAGGWIAVHRAGLPRASRRSRRAHARARCACSASRTSRAISRCGPTTCAAASRRCARSCTGSASRRAPPSARSRELDAGADARARGLWDVAALRASYARSCARARGERGAARARSRSDGDGRVLPPRRPRDPRAGARPAAARAARARRRASRARRRDAPLRPRRPPRLGELHGALRRPARRAARRTASAVAAFG